MFTLSKLVSLSLGVLVIGSSGGIAVPAILGTSNFLWEGDVSKWGYKLEELEKTEEEISEKLTKSKVRYSRALKWLEYLKSFNYKTIFDSFTNLFKFEGDLEKKYKQVQESIKELITLIEREGETAIKKLTAQKDIQLLNTYSSALSSLSKGFDGWEQELKKIICAIEEGDSGASSCKSQDLISKVLKLIGFTTDNQQTSGASSSSPFGGGGTQSGGEQAKRSLQEVKEELEKMIKSIGGIIKETFKTKFKVSTMQASKWTLMATLDVLLATITAQKSVLSKNVDSISKEANKLIQQIRVLTETIKSVNKNLELIKQKLRVVKNYEGMFLNSLCNLYTQKPTECSSNNL